MSEIIFPIATDATLVKVAEALSASSLKIGAIKEILQVICDNMSDSGDESGSGIFFVDVVYADGTYSLAGNVNMDTIQTAYEEKKLPILRITDTEKSKVFHNANLSVNGQVFSWGIPQNGSPSSGENVCVIANGRVIFTSIYTASADVSCNVKIGGVTCKTLDAALTAIANAINGGAS